MNTPEQDWQDRAMSYSLDDDELEEIEESCPYCAVRGCQGECRENNREFEALLEREAEHQERERQKRDCFAGLLALGLLPRSLAVDYVRRGEL